LALGHYGPQPLRVLLRTKRARGYYRPITAELSSAVRCSKKCSRIRGYDVEQADRRREEGLHIRIQIGSGGEASRLSGTGQARLRTERQLTRQAVSGATCPSCRPMLADCSVADRVDTPTSAAVAVMLAVMIAKSGGDGWESNPPGTPQQRPADGFEDRVSGSPSVDQMPAQRPPEMKSH